MSMYNILENKLFEWCNEYDIDITCITFQFKDIITTYYEGKVIKCLGLTYFRHDGNDRCCNVDILESMNNEFLATSVFWHEFCHCEPWIKDGISDGHSGTWSKRLWRKPIYAIGQWIAKLAYGGIKF